MQGVLIALFLVVLFGGVGGAIWAITVRSSLRESKNFERGLKMVPVMIHLPPASEDINNASNSRDQRDIVEEVLSQAQAMYNIISSTATKGFKSKIYGQRHVSFEIVARDGIVYYYAVVPVVLIDVVKQALAAAYPTARLEEMSEHNVFSKVGKMSGTIGGEFTLKQSFSLPIATYMESRRDASRALLNAIASATREDGIGVQILFRPAPEGWTSDARKKIDKIKKDRASGKGGSVGLAGFVSVREIIEAPWKPPETKDSKPEEKIENQLTTAEQKKIEAIEDKIRYPGFEVLIRVVVSSNTATRSQTLLKNIIAAFSLFDSPSLNGFKFTMTKNVDELVTAYIFRFFPQAVRSNVLNSVELATLFHLPDQKSIPTAQVQRQKSKQVDGPTQVMEQGLLIGYNEFRGIKKPIRIEDSDRRRHIHIIGQTGVGKSVLQENLAYQDMMDGRGFAFVDPHGDSVESLLSKVPKERVEDVIYFNPSDMDNPIGLNMFEFDHPDQKDFLVQEAISMLYGLYDPGHTGIVGPRLEHIFRNAALLLMSDPKGGTFIDIPKVLIDKEYMKSKLKYVTDQTVLDFWTKEWPESQRSNEAGEVISWVVSKFGPFVSNDAMRNIIGQTKSSFNIRDIMDNKKILLVNLSKGKMGDLNSRLIGIVFVMKFQAAAFSRANIPEDQREDFTLFVDEFQNFATDSFQTILSEARKYRLSLVLGNQFMTQLKEELREAIIGNVGTTITGRIGITDAEIMVKRYQPVFDAEDLTKLPNFESVVVAQIQGVPSAPFSMNWVPPMGQTNPQLSDALKRLSAAKYARPRSEVEREIFARLSPPKPAGLASGSPTLTDQKSSGSSFLDEWLEKRKQMGGGAQPPQLKGTTSPTDKVQPTAYSTLQSSVSSSGSDVSLASATPQQPTAQLSPSPMVLNTSPQASVLPAISPLDQSADKHSSTEGSADLASPTPQVARLDSKQPQMNSEDKIDLRNNDSLDGEVSFRVR